MRNWPDMTANFLKKLDFCTELLPADRVIFVIHKLRCLWAGTTNSCSGLFPETWASWIRIKSGGIRNGDFQVGENEPRGACRRRRSSPRTKYPTWGARILLLTASGCQRNKPSPNRLLHPRCASNLPSCANHCGGDHFHPQAEPWHVWQSQSDLKLWLAEVKTRCSPGPPS